MAAWRLSPQAPPACVNFKSIGELLDLSASGVWSVVGQRKGAMGQGAEGAVRGGEGRGLWAW